MAHEEAIGFGPNRPRGTTSRLRRAAGARRAWVAPNGVELDLPVIFDLVHVDGTPPVVVWAIEATITCVSGQPVVSLMEVRCDDGLDLVHLQREFRWASPLEAVTRLVPELIAAGDDPFAYDYPVTGFPDVTRSADVVRRRLTDQFLEDIAREYLEVGRGYARVLARRHSVSERTVVSWIERARARGILSNVRRGEYGGAIVPANNRANLDQHSTLPE